MNAKLQISTPQSENIFSQHRDSRVNIKKVMYFVQKILRAYPDLYFAQTNDHIIIMLGGCLATLYIGTQNVTFFLGSFKAVS